MGGNHDDRLHARDRNRANRNDTLRILGQSKRSDGQDRAAEKLANLAIVVVSQRGGTRLRRVVIFAGMMLFRVICAIVRVCRVVPRGMPMRRFGKRMHMHVRRAREHDRQQIRPGGEQVRRSADEGTSHDENPEKSRARPRITWGKRESLSRFYSQLNPVILVANRGSGQARSRRAGNTLSRFSPPKILATVDAVLLF